VPLSVRAVLEGSGLGSWNIFSVVQISGLIISLVKSEVSLALRPCHTPSDIPYFK
jgi:hypothetical protein